MSETAKLDTTETLTALEIKQRVTFPELVAHYGYRTEHSKMICPFHQEKTPSFHVYDNGGKCYGGCGWVGDVIQFVIDKEGAYFGEALRLLCEWFGFTKGTLPQKPVAIKTAPKRVRPEPINQEIIQYFHEQLTKERRQWLYEKRLLIDETIDYYHLGWRSDMEAYSIPFWKGVPGLSDVDVLQFRLAPKEGRKARYLSLDDHGFAGLVGRHTINPDFLVMFIGTIDAILAGQDGIPAISPNGLTVWRNCLDELAWLIGPVKEFYLVPDNSTSETVESTRLANALGAKIRYLPQMENGKDYTDYRQDHTPQQFIEEVLKVSKSPFIENTEHVQTVEDILEFTSQAAGNAANELLEILELNGYAWWAISHKLMCIASAHPFSGMNDREWEELIRRLEYAHSYKDIGLALIETVEELLLRSGDF